MLMSSLLLLLLLLTVELLLFCFKPQPHNDLGGLSNSQANQPTPHTVTISLNEHRYKEFVFLPWFRSIFCSLAKPRPIRLIYSRGAVHNMMLLI